MSKNLKLNFKLKKLSHKDKSALLKLKALLSVKHNFS